MMTTEEYGNGVIIPDEADIVRNPPGPDDLITMRQAATWCGKSVNTIKNYTQPRKGSKNPGRLKMQVVANKAYTTRRWLHECIVQLDMRGRGASVLPLPPYYRDPDGNPVNLEAPDGYVSQSEAARMLGLSRQRLSVLVRNGEFPMIEQRPWGKLISRTAVLKRRDNPPESGVRHSG